MFRWKILVSRGCKKEVPAKCGNFLAFGLRCVPALLMTTLWAWPLMAQTTEGTTASPPQSMP